jgi:tRNA threonylcarbamoyladenosine biosynthesis protein TsaB
MKILALETSTMLGGVAIANDAAGLIAESRLNIKSTYSEKLMTEIDHILRQSMLTISDIDVFGISIGPGSFTGLRIGLSTLKGFAFATGKPIVSVPTLEALAWNFPYSGYPVCTMLDARKNEVYAALFRWEGETFRKVFDEVAIPADRLLKTIKETVDNAREKIVFAGEGALLYKREIIGIMGDMAVFASPERIVPSPANIAILGLKKALKGEFSEPVSLIPRYIRKSEAEIKSNG